MKGYIIANKINDDIVKGKVHFKIGVRYFNNYFKIYSSNSIDHVISRIPDNNVGIYEVEWEGKCEISEDYTLLTDLCLIKELSIDEIVKEVKENRSLIILKYKFNKDYQYEINYTSIENILLDYKFSSDLSTVLSRLEKVVDHNTPDNIDLSEFLIDNYTKLENNGNLMKWAHTNIPLFISLKYPETASFLYENIKGNYSINKFLRAYPQYYNKLMTTKNLKYIYYCLKCLIFNLRKNK